MPNLNVHLSIIEYSEGENSSSIKYAELVNENLVELNNLAKDKTSDTKKISIWESSGSGHRRIGGRQIAGQFDKEVIDKGYTDIIIDISALPRGIYFSLVGKLLSLIDKYGRDSKPNLFVFTSENADLDSLIERKGIGKDFDYPHGFSGGVDMEAYNKQPTIWLPLLGEGKQAHFEKAYQQISPDEICPLLPFPSKNPRRSDNIFTEHHEQFFDVLRIESQNILYVPEQNPFEAYRIIMNTLGNYQESLNVIGGCKGVISTFSSKLLSIGAILAAFELNDKKMMHVGVLNVDSSGCDIVDIDSFKSLRPRSELFVTWLAGSPYLDE